MKKIILLLASVCLLCSCAGKEPAEDISGTGEQQPNIEATAAPEETPAVIKQEQPKASSKPAEKPIEKKNEQQPEEPQKESPAVSETVSLRIYGESEMLNVEATPEEKENAAQFTKRIAEQNGIKVKIRGAGKMGYIVSIGDLAEFDRGAESGWTYTVNGVYQSVGAGNITVSPGDKIEWIYKM